VGKIGYFLAGKKAVCEADPDGSTTRQAIVSLPNISIYIVWLY